MSFDSGAGGDHECRVPSLHCPECAQMYQESGEGGVRDDRKLLKQVWTDQERGEGLYQRA